MENHDVMQVPVTDTYLEPRDEGEDDPHKRKDAAAGCGVAMEMDPSPKKNRRAAAEENTEAPVRSEVEKWAPHPSVCEALEFFIRKRLHAKPMFPEPTRDGRFYNEAIEASTLCIPLPLEVLEEGAALFARRLSKYLQLRLNNKPLSYWEHHPAAEVCDWHTRDGQLLLTVRVSDYLQRNPIMVRL